ncbi:MAG: hypothetical protein M1818_001774 [Claussenomyces sp. TS43310]|nr:MAG: hypothetical protein M1818_001774 [Claussenomyces sp. TS43310]
MSKQLWVQSEKRDVQKVKQWLGESLSRQDRVRHGRDGQMLTPTIWRCDDEQIEQALVQHALPSELGGGPMEMIALASRAGEEADPKTGVLDGVVRKWLAALPAALLDSLAVRIAELQGQCPRRWSLYRPMLLLPSGSFDSPAWTSVLRHVEPAERARLWRGILDAVSLKDGGGALSRLAVNAGIPVAMTGSASHGENVLRSPSGLVMLYGDFGSVWAPDEMNPSPSPRDFEDAFWVSTKQNGIYQVWAPRYTMFSRGNIKEKARIMSFHHPEAARTLARKRVRNWERGSAVDLYAGIGYFVFSYAAMGMLSILGWEINPWSVEGLRRGAIGNGWKVKVVRGIELKKPMHELLSDGDHIVIFEENNEYAGSRIAELRRLQHPRPGCALLGENVVHVNCGLLPDSRPSWRTALHALSRERGGWLHLHENVAKPDIEGRSREIEKEFCNWTTSSGRLVEMEHVELVKTFAPGVWHCVFDVYVGPALP